MKVCEPGARGGVFSREDGRAVWRLFYRGRSFTRAFPAWCKRAADVRIILEDENADEELIDVEPVT